MRELIELMFQVAIFTRILLDHEFRDDRGVVTGQWEGTRRFVDPAAGAFFGKRR